MLFAEFLALIGILGGSVVGVTGIARLLQNSAKNSERKAAQILKRHADLEEALTSRDHNKLNDWLVLYAEEISPETKQHVESRRDELYIEKNP